MTALRCGVALQGVDEPVTFAAMVREIEDLGFDHLWITDSSLHARNCYVTLAMAALHSAHLRLGTAVTNPLTRHPAITAAAIASVDELSGGRAVLGIGTGDRPLLALGLKPSPLADLEAAVVAMRSLWRGDEVDVEAGSFSLHEAKLRFAARADIPVFVSASGPRTLELAGRLADGVIVLAGLSTEAVRWALEHVDGGAGAVAAGAGIRPHVEGGAGAAATGIRPHLAVFAYGAIDADRRRALEHARSIAAWFPQTAPVACRLAGLPDEVSGAVRRAYAGGEFQEAAAAAALLPDDFVRKMALAGDEADARERIEAVLGGGADSMHVFPLGDRRMDTVRAFARCWRDVTGAL